MGYEDENEYLVSDQMKEKKRREQETKDAIFPCLSVNDYFYLELRTLDFFRGRNMVSVTVHLNGLRVSLIG